MAHLKDHNCIFAGQLKNVDGLPWLPPGSSLWKRLLRQLRILTLESDRHCRTNVYVSSRADFLQSRKKQFQSKYWYIIHPQSMLRSYWNLLFTPMSVFAYVTVPFAVAFMEPVSYYKYTLLFSCLCVIDLILTCLTGFHTNQSKALILEPSLILQCYITESTFFIDLLSTIPWQEMLLLSGYINKKYVHLLGVFKIIRLFRLRITLRMIDNYLQTFYVSYETINLILMLLQLVIALHHAVCSFPFAETICHNFFNVHPQNRSMDDTMISQYFRATNQLSSIWCEPATFKRISFCNLMFLIPLRIYFYHFFMVLEVRMVKLAWSITQRQTKFDILATQLEEFMNEQQLPNHLRKRCLQLFHYRTIRESFAESIIFATVSNSLRNKIQMHCFKKITNSPLFLNIDKPTQSTIASRLKCLIFAPNDIIIKYNTLVDGMFFLSCGTLAVYTPAGQEVQHSCEGDFFGEFEMLPSVPYTRAPVFIMAITYCEVYFLKAKDCFRFLLSNPLITRRLEKTALIRMARLAIVTNSNQKLESNISLLS